MLFSSSSCAKGSKPSSIKQAERAASPGVEIILYGHTVFNVSIARL